MVSLVLIMMMILSLGVNSFATSDLSEIIEDIEIPYDIYIQHKAESLGVSIEEAIVIDEEENTEYKKNLQKRHPELFETDLLMVTDIRSTPTFIYKTIKKTQEYEKNNLYSATVYADIKIYVDSDTAFREIVEVLGNVYSRREEGWGNYEWVELNAWDSPSGNSYPTDEVQIRATGYFKVQVDSSVSVGVELFGFEMSGSDIYQSKNMTIDYEYSLY